MSGDRKWTTCDFKDLPEWLLKDSNGYLHKGHRPATASIQYCLKSIFKLHTETGMNWYLLMCISNLTYM